MELSELTEAVGWRGRAVRKLNLSLSRSGSFYRSETIDGDIFTFVDTSCPLSRHANLVRVILSLSATLSFFSLLVKKDLLYVYKVEIPGPQIFFSLYMCKITVHEIQSFYGNI